MAHPIDDSRAPASERWMVAVLACVQFTHLVDYLIVVPLAPHLAADLHCGELGFALLVSTYNFAAGAATLLFSAYADRIEPKRLLMGLYLPFALVTLGCGLANSFEMMLVLRAVAGALGGLLTTTCLILLAQFVPHQRMGRAMAANVMAFTAANVAGVPLALLLADAAGWHAPFQALALVCAVLFIIAAAVLPRSHGHRAGARRSVWEACREVLSGRDHQWGLAFAVLLMFGSFTVTSFLTLYLQANAHLGNADIALFYFCGGAAALATSWPIGQVSDRLGKQWTLRLLTVGAALTVMLVSVSASFPRVAILAAGAAFFCISNGRLVPANAMLATIARPELRGTYLNIVVAMQSIALAIAPLCSGLIVSRASDGSLNFFWVCAMLAAASNAAVFFLAPRVEAASLK